MMKLCPLSTLVFTATIFALTTSLDISSFTSLKLTSATYIIIQNLRHSPVDYVVVRDVDPFDFESGSGPQEKFKDLSIPAKRAIERQLEVNTFASRAPFTMDLIFNDGTTATFHVNMKYAVDGKNAEFAYEAPFNINFRKQVDRCSFFVGELERGI
ncbi:uncharacterized protein LOC135142341 [Zophobas morio]|uniref:uncharacterized protein LOC135142341 n=1 Tax=Zophobas morio TaxID=2755281 RepID=UPI0030828287